MKSVKFFVSVLVSSFLLAGTVSAIEKAESNAAVTAESSLKNQVASVVSKISTQETGNVFVYFSVSANGFEVLNVVGENAELVSEVKKALKSDKVKIESSLEGRYKVKVRFTDKYDYYLADNN